MKYSKRIGTLKSIVYSLPSSSLFILEHYISKTSQKCNLPFKLKLQYTRIMNANTHSSQRALVHFPLTNLSNNLKRSLLINLGIRLNQLMDKGLFQIVFYYFLVNLNESRSASERFSTLFIVAVPKAVRK